MTLDKARRIETPVGEGVSTLLLLVLILLTVTGSIQAANWADGLGILTWSALAGLGLGILFAKLPVRGRVAHPFMLVSGVGATAFFATSLLPDVLSLEEKFVVLDERFWIWISKARFGGVSSDNLMFVVQVAYFAWIMGYLAGWFVYRRHQVWGAIVPTGAAILFNLFYALPQPGFYFTLFILSGLLLIVRTNLQAMEQWWRQAAVGYSGDISFDFLTYGAGFSVLLIVMAWMIPSSGPGPSWLAAFEPLQEPWQQVEDQFNRVFGSLRAVARPPSSGFFGSTLTMGGPVNLGQRPVMDIQANKGRYWRATVYDKYIGNGWINTHSTIVNMGANDPRFGTAVGALREEVTQTYKVYIFDQNMLYAESQPIQFDIPTEIRYGQEPASEGGDATMDLAIARARRPLKAGDSYTVISAVSLADEESLRQASVEYSPWIKANYLQLPDSVPPRVRALARTITTKYSNPYDKATAIEHYLRTKIKYNDNVSAPPEGRDGVDYTLFDRPEGYCNYYASAMTVLARSAGIPARVVSGYSMGDLENGEFHIIEANAHSWVEVYFPAYGWIEFEPTSSKPEIDRPKKADSSKDDGNQPPEDAEAAARRKAANREFEDPQDFGSGNYIPFVPPLLQDPRAFGLAGAGTVGLLGIGMVAVLEWKRHRRMAKLTPAAHFYENLVDRARWLGVSDQTYATPFERAGAIVEALPRVRSQVDQATTLYVRETFGARPLDAAERADLNRSWLQVRKELWRSILRRIAMRIITPPREWARDFRRSIERWGQG